MTLAVVPASVNLQFIVMDILCVLPRARNGNLFIIGTTVRHSKITKAIPFSKTTATPVVNVFLDHWIVPYGIPNRMLSDNGPQFVIKFFAMFCELLDLYDFTKIAYHPQTSEQIESHNRTIVASLLYYVSEHQDNLDNSASRLRSRNNTQTHRSTGTSVLGLLLSRHPPGETTFDFSSAIPLDLSGIVFPRILRSRRLLRLLFMREKIYSGLTAARSVTKAIATNACKKNPGIQNK